MARDDAYGVYFIFKSMEQGPRGVSESLCKRSRIFRFEPSAR